MISITTKSPYALQALAELGRSGDAGPVPIGELAKRRDIPWQVWSARGSKGYVYYYVTASR